MDTTKIPRGDARSLEVVDLLSADAVRVGPGTHVLLERWGGDQPLEARVRFVEPTAFTKVSALGVEEQRVVRYRRHHRSSRTVAPSG